MATIYLRVPDELADDVKERADLAGASVNEWAQRVFRWALSQPLQTAKKTITTEVRT